MDMNMDQYIVSVAQRYDTLSDEQKDSVRAFKNTDVGRTISYILGPELGQLIGDLREPMPLQPTMAETATLPEQSEVTTEDTPLPMNTGGFIAKTAGQPKPEPKRKRGIAARKQK